MKKPTMVFTVACILSLCADAADALTNRSTSEISGLDTAFDLNGNGKIDAGERRAYNRELSRQRRQEAKALAAHRPMLSEQERQFYHPPRLTPELIHQYDTNRNGRLELPEQLALQTAATDAAKQEFRRYDLNNDGKLDKEELKSARHAKQAEVPRQPPAGTSTNSPPHLP